MFYLLESEKRKKASLFKCYFNKSIKEKKFTKQTSQRKSTFATIKMKKMDELEVGVWHAELFHANLSQMFLSFLVFTVFFYSFYLYIKYIKNPFQNMEKRIQLQTSEK
jgi:hypothetical protein